MRIISKGTLVLFWSEYRDCEQQLKTRYMDITSKDRDSIGTIIYYFSKADHVGNNRVVFNICGNKYRLIVCFHCHRKIGYIRFLGTHTQYDKITDIKNI